MESCIDSIDALWVLETSRFLKTSPTLASLPLPRKKSLAARGLTVEPAVPLGNPIPCNIAIRHRDLWRGCGRRLG